MRPLNKFRGFMVLLMQPTFGPVTQARNGVRRCRQSSDVRRRIGVRVGSIATRTRELVLISFAQSAAATARLRGIGGVNKDHVDTRRFGFVDDIVLKLAKRPTVKPCADPLPCFDAVSDMGQIFETHHADAFLYSMVADTAADCVVDIAHASRLSTRGVLQSLFSRLAAVGLKSFAKCNMQIALMARLLTPKHQSGGRTRQPILSNVDAHNRVIRAFWSFGHVQSDIEIPHALATDQFGFLDSAHIQVGALVPSGQQSDDSAWSQCGQTQVVTPDAVGPLVVVHGAIGPEVDQRDITPKRLIGRANVAHGLTHHLRTQSETFSQVIVRPVMEVVLAKAAVVKCNASRFVAHARILTLHGLKALALPISDQQLVPSSDVFAALDVPLNRCSSNIARCTDKVRRRPQPITLNGVLESRKVREKAPCCSPFEDFNGISYGDGWRNRQKQVDVVGLNLFGDHGPRPVSADRIEQVIKRLRNVTGQYASAIFWAPNHMVRGLVNTIPVSKCSDHTHMVCGGDWKRNIGARFLPWLKSEVSARRVL